MRPDLAGLVQEQPRASLDEVTRELFRRTGKKVNPVTVRKALRQAGLSGSSRYAGPTSPARSGYWLPDQFPEGRQLQPSPPLRDGHQLPRLRDRRDNHSRRT